MKVLAWNCRGLPRGPTIRALRALIRAHHPYLLFLSETKVPSSRFWSSLVGLGFSASNPYSLFHSDQEWKEPPL
jgi:hypothetical protein